MVAFTPLNPVGTTACIRFITFFQGCLMRCPAVITATPGDTHGGKEVTVEDLMKEVVTHRHFMNASGGGVTASGGEAILQVEFVRDSGFRACKKEGIQIPVCHQRFCSSLRSG
ncbi:4Fe-4S cluster-binding domain-containing protein [Klebsiella pneumoniae]|nr:4Fe-4S cluster-binding domain-containing protein [Klebsiella pneumoniae]